jgi:hypothetical protein
MLVQLVLGAAAVYMIYIGTVGKKGNPEELRAENLALAGEAHIMSESDRPGELGGAAADTGTKTATDEVQSHTTEPEKNKSLTEGLTASKVAAHLLTKDASKVTAHPSLTKDASNVATPSLY